MPPEPENQARANSSASGLPGPSKRKTTAIIRSGVPGQTLAVFEDRYPLTKAVYILRPRTCSGERPFQHRQRGERVAGSNNE
jgi:hypothetical protein